MQNEMPKGSEESLPNRRETVVKRREETEAELEKHRLERKRVGRLACPSKPHCIDFTLCVLLLFFSPLGQETSNLEWLRRVTARPLQFAIASWKGIGENHGLRSSWNVYADCESSWAAAQVKLGNYCFAEGKRNSWPTRG